MTLSSLIRGELLADDPARGPTVFGRFDGAALTAASARSFALESVRIDGFRFNHLFFPELPEPGRLCHRIATRVPATPPYEVDLGCGAVFLADLGVIYTNLIHMARIDATNEEPCPAGYTVTPEGLYHFSKHDRDDVVVIDFITSRRRPGWGAPTWSEPGRPIKFAMVCFTARGGYDGVFQRFPCVSRRLVAPMPFEHVTITDVDIVIPPSVEDAGP